MKSPWHSVPRQFLHFPSTEVVSSPGTTRITSRVLSTSWKPCRSTDASEPTFSCIASCRLSSTGCLTQSGLRFGGHFVTYRCQKACHAWGFEAQRNLMENMPSASATVMECTARWPDVHWRSWTMKLKIVTMQPKHFLILLLTFSYQDAKH